MQLECRVPLVKLRIYIYIYIYKGCGGDSVATVLCNFSSIRKIPWYEHEIYNFVYAKRYIFHFASKQNNSQTIRKTTLVDMFFATAPPRRFDVFQEVTFQLKVVNTASTFQTAKLVLCPKSAWKAMSFSPRTNHRKTMII